MASHDLLNSRTDTRTACSGDLILNPVKTFSFTRDGFKTFTKAVVGKLVILTQLDLR